MLIIGKDVDAVIANRQNTSQRSDLREVLVVERRRHVRALLLPMYFAAFWMMLPFVVLLVSPLPLELENPLTVFCYVLLNAILFCIGYLLFGMKTLASRSGGESLRTIQRVIRSGFFVALIILPFSIFVYTGKSIFDIASILDQRAVYSDLVEVFEEESTTRKILSLVRGLVAPLTIAVIPLAAFYWTQLGTVVRTFAMGTALTYILFSAFRGTDKETGDLVILTLSGILARAAFLGIRGRTVSKRGMVNGVIFISLIVSLFIALFIFRKSERLGGFVAFCLYGDVACFEPSSISVLGDVVGFGFAMFSAYLVQGYYGLSLALSLDYEWTYGIGHSQPLQTLAGIFVDAQAIYEKGPMAQLQAVGWHDRFVWSSIFPSLAGDVTFAGIPIVFFIMGILYGRSWSSALAKGGVDSIVLFALLTIVILYIPANNQIAQSFDLYFAAVFWLITFIARKHKDVQR